MFLSIINNYLPVLLYSEKIIYCWSEIGTIYGILTYGILILKWYFNLWYVQRKRTSRTCSIQNLAFCCVHVFTVVY